MKNDNVQLSIIGGNVEGEAYNHAILEQTFLASIGSDVPHYKAKCDDNVMRPNSDRSPYKA